MSGSAMFGVPPMRRDKALIARWLAELVPASRAVDVVREVFARIDDWNTRNPSDPIKSPARSAVWRWIVLVRQARSSQGPSTPERTRWLARAAMVPRRPLFRRRKLDARVEGWMQQCVQSVYLTPARRAKKDVFLEVEYRVAQWNRANPQTPLTCPSPSTVYRYMRETVDPLVAYRARFPRRR